MFRRLIKDAVDRGVKRGCEQAIDEFFQSDEFKGRIRGIFDSVVAEPRFAFFRFIKQMQARLQEVDKTLSDKRAFFIARNTYLEFLRDEEIEFGDPRFDWSRDGARDLIQAYEIDHWESAA